MTAIPDAAKPRPIRAADAKVPLVDKLTGLPSPHAVVQQEQMRNYILGAGRIIPCSASGTNVITLTPNDASPLLEKYVFGDVFLFWAENTSTGAVTATVVPATGTLPTLKVYPSNNAAQAGAGAIVANGLYLAYYVPTLDSNAGGFVAVGTGAGSVIESGTVTSQATLDITLSSAYDLYEIDLINFVPATDAVSLYMRFSQSGSFLSGASDYVWAVQENGVGGADEADSELDLAGINVGNQTDEGIRCATIRIFRPGAASFIKVAEWRGWGRTATPTSFSFQGAGHLALNSDAIDGVRFIFASGNIASGYYTVRAY